MGDSVEQIIDGILKREGGYVDVPEDRGKATKFGITRQTLSDWRKQVVTPGDVELLKEDEARAIYRSEYVEKPGFAEIAHGPLQELLVDCAVSHGPDRAVRWLQQALGVAGDGVLGPKTKEILDASAQWTVYDRVLASRARFYGRIISEDHSQAVFAGGWMERLAEFIERA